MSLQDAVKELTNLFTIECVRRLDDDSVPQEVPRISSGSPKLDKLLGGGWPMGRLVELYGEDGSGKTTLSWFLSELINSYT